MTLNLHSGKYYPYRKPGNLPLYIDVQSDHPPSVVKHMSKSISGRISDLSFDQAEFDKAAPIYYEVLKSSGFLQSLSYIRPKQHSKKNRSRNILWFNPQFSKTVKTNVGKQFLSLIDKHFTVNNPWCRIFNRGTIKVSYSCIQNMKCIRNNHNSKALRNTEAPKKTTIAE